MVKWINSWGQGIILAVIISTIIEMILPEGKIKKYVRTIIGTYIVFVVISPIISKITGKEIKLDLFDYTTTTQAYNIASIDTNAYIESTYINNLKSKIIQDIKNKGYIVKDVIIKLEESEQDYGNINEIEIVLKKDNNVKEIDKIKVKIKEDNEIKTSVDEFEELKEYLSQNYGTKLENIEIRQEEN